MSTGLVCWVHDDAFAQGLSSLRSILQRIAGCAPAPAAGQCPAPIAGYPARSAVDPAGVKSGNWARRGAIEIHERRSRARSGGAAENFGCEVVRPPTAARVPPRRLQCHQSISGGGLICLRSRHGSGGSQIKQGRGFARGAGRGFASQVTARLPSWSKSSFCCAAGRSRRRSNSRTSSC